jgi:hypothetical protein
MPRQILCLQVLEEIVYVFLGHLTSFLESRRYYMSKERRCKIHLNFKKCKNPPPLMPHDLHMFRFLITFCLTLYSG